MTSPARAAGRRRGAGAALLGAAFWAVEAALALPVAAGVLAAVLPPGPFWWAQLAAVGLPYTGWALAAWTPVVALGRRRRLALGHLLLLGVVAWRAAPTAPAPAPADVLGGDDVLRLVTFNVPQQGPSREALSDSMVAFVRRARPHLLALQDAWIFEPSPTHRMERSDHIAAVERALPYGARLPARLAEAPGWRRPGTGVPLLVHDSLQVTRRQALDIGQAGGDVTSLAVRAEVAWRGRRFALYNVHLRSFGENKPWHNDSLRRGTLRARLRSAVPYARRYRRVYAQRGAEADALARIVAADSLPAVVVGDLNSTGDNWSARRLRTAGAPRLDAQRARGDGWGRTYPAHRPLVRIDVVYADPAFEVLAAETAPVGFSDHRPVRAWLRWRDGG